MRTWSAMSLRKQQPSSTHDAVRHLRCGLLVPGRPATTLDRRQRASARTQNVTTIVRRNQGWLQLLEKLGKTKLYGTAVRSLVFETYQKTERRRTPSCCVIWWQRRRQTDSAARMLSDDGGPSWSECC